MRLGLYEADLADGSIAAELYGAPTASERHRHRYEVNNHFRQQIADAGLWFSGLSPDGQLVEYVELPRDVHPFYIGTQAHPELRSRPNNAHPLFRGLVGAALDRQNASRLFEDAEAE
jgi:CTP synthase